MKYILALGIAAAVLAGAMTVAAMSDPHDQIVDGIKAAQDACHAADPRNDYERRICALVAP